MESLNSQRNFGAGTKTKRNPLRQSNGKSGTKLSDRNDSSHASNKGRKGAAVGVGAKWKSTPAEKENLVSTAPESSVNAADETQETEADVTNASLPVDPDNEMAEIDARLNALQNFMKSMGHE